MALSRLQVLFLFSIWASALLAQTRAECVVDPDIVDADPSCPDDEMVASAETDAGLFEGDIKMGDAGGTDRNAIIEERRKWPKSSDGLVYIPYEFSRVSSQVEKVVKSAAESYEKNTCIRFRPKKSGDSNYIVIKALDGCFSSLGMTGRAQDVSLGNGCEYHGTAVHEFMHAIGFLHEQSRPDRDEYITIVYENIQSGMESQFRKGDTREVRNIQTYDYKSIMHYQETAFSKNRQPTMRAKKSGVTTLGQRQGFTKEDIAKVNELYECDTDGPGPRPTPDPRPTPNPTSGPGGDCEDSVSSSTCRSYMRRYTDFCDEEFSKMCQKSCDNCDGGPGPTNRPPTDGPRTNPTNPPSNCEDTSRYCGSSIQSIPNFCYTHRYRTRCNKSCGKC